MFDGICLQRWSVWLNWMQTHESYDAHGIHKDVGGARLHSALDERRGCNPHCRKVFTGESKSACPCMCRQLTHYTQTLDREWVPVTRSLEPGIASKMCLASLVEWPSQVCTHRPSHCISSRSSEVVTRCPSWKVGMDRARYPSRSVCHPALLPTEP